jgi:predicted O-methyltransferase YrrM
MPIDSRILSIPGHMHKDELIWIYSRSCEAPPGGVIVEIGSYRGRSAAAWYQGIQGRGTLYCIDPWDAAYPEGLPSDYEIFKTQMKMMGYAPTVLRMSSMEAALLFDDGSLDIVFIDGNHAEVGLDIDRWLPKLKPMGLLCGHDWRRGRALEGEILARLPDAMLVTGSIWEWRNAITSVSEKTGSWKIDTADQVPV